MPTTPRPVRDSIWEIDGDSWIIGNRTLLSRQRSPPLSGPAWSDGNGSFYVISKAPDPLPPSRPLPATATNIQMVYDAGEVSAVWRIGEAFVKAKILDQGVTREHVTLGYLRNKSISFSIPDVYYYTEHDGRYYIILSRLAGETLTETWPDMDEEIKQHYVSRVAGICQEMGAWRGEDISGVDGQYLSDTHLTRSESPADLSPQKLLSTCKDLGMDCSTLMFYHCDLGPGNIIVNLTDRSIGIIDWEAAGFVPTEWIRTKFRVCGGMDLPGIDQEYRGDWRRRVQWQLGTEGYPEIAERWMAWFMNKD